MQRDTQLIHHPYRPPEGFESPQVPVYKASTVCFPDLASFRARNMRSRSGYSYGLHGTPTVYTLEQRIATLEGARHCLLTPSGLSAITVVDYALLAAGDEVLLPDNVYAPSRDLARHELQRFGITHRFYDPLDADALAEMIGPATRLVWIEAPGSVTMEFPDVAGLAAAARAKGVLSAFDNTWGAGVAFDPFALGVDVSIHALTKYPSGGGDVLMGSVCTRDDALHERLLLTHARMGWGIAGNDAELVLRSLPTMVMRYRVQDQAARELARWMATRPEIARVLHPALEGSPGHGYWKTSCRAAAGLFSVLFDARFAQPQVDRFVEALQLFRIGSSWAGPSSLVVPYDLQAMRGSAPYAGSLVRFSVGLESVEDLKADVARALSSIGRA